MQPPAGSHSICESYQYWSHGFGLSSHYFTAASACTTTGSPHITTASVPTAAESAPESGAGLPPLSSRIQEQRNELIDELRLAEEAHSDALKSGTLHDILVADMKICEQLQTLTDDNNNCHFEKGRILRALNRFFLRRHVRNLSLLLNRGTNPPPTDVAAHLIPAESAMSDIDVSCSEEEY